jgi:hypothetical protein
MLAPAVLEELAAFRYEQFLLLGVYIFQPGSLLVLPMRARGSSSLCGAGIFEPRLSVIFRRALRRIAESYDAPGTNVSVPVVPAILLDACFSHSS